jgi:hypothetical protein
VAGKPVFLGAIVQSFKLFRGKAKRAYQFWIDKIPEKIDQCLVPALSQFDSTGKSLVQCGDAKAYLAAEIPDFGTLAPLAQSLGKAVFAIEQKDTVSVTQDGQPWKGGTWADAQNRMAEYRATFEKLETRLEGGC